jgi:hypothetical protein
MSNDFNDFDPIETPDKDLEDKFRRLEQEEELEAFKSQAGAASGQDKFFVVLCPQCSGKNRVSLSKVRSKMPRCGRCKGELLS